MQKCYERSAFKNKQNESLIEKLRALRGGDSKASNDHSTTGRKHSA